MFLLASGGEWGGEGVSGNYAGTTVDALATTRVIPDDRDAIRAPPSRPPRLVLCRVLPVPAGQVLDTGQHAVLHEGGGAIDAGGYGSDGGVWRGL